MSSSLHRGARRAALIPMTLALALLAATSAATPAHAAKAGHHHRHTSKKVAHRLRTRSVSSGLLAAPTLWVEGTRLRWSPRSSVSSYVLATKVPGATTAYSIVTGTGYTPDAVPGTTVTYGVRTNYTGSRWSTERSITYPAITQTVVTAPTTTTTTVTAPPTTTTTSTSTTPTTTTAPTTTTTTTTTPTTTTPTTSTAPAPAPAPVPVLQVDGQTLRWAPLSGISTYEVATKVPGQATTYLRTSATSYTPPVVPGTTVTYGLIAVPGTTWAKEVSITYPATAVAPAPPAGTLYTGVATGFWGDHTQPANDAALLHAKTIRMGVQIGTSTSTLDGYIASYWAKGIRVMLLAEFSGRVPTTDEARNVASWASRYGAGGSYWAGKANPTPTRWIEFGNETAYTYQFTDNSAGTYAQRAKDYAARVRDARQAMDAAGTVAQGVGLLAQSDPNPAWESGMFAGVPDLGSYVAGWTMHPYGPLDVIKTKMDGAIANLAGQGVQVNSSKPMFITEYGIASDNGRTLQSNYGWPRNMTYQQAADGYLSAESMVRSTYGDKLRLFIIYSGRDLQNSGASDYQEDYFGSLTNNSWGMTGGTKGAITTAVQGIMDRGA